MFLWVQKTIVSHQQKLAKYPPIYTCQGLRYNADWSQIFLLEFNTKICQNKVQDLNNIFAVCLSNGHGLDLQGTMLD